MSKMEKIAAMTAALLISASTMSYMPQDSLTISNVTANAAEEEITSVEINETNFPDENFREYVKSSFDTDGDGVLSAEEIAAVTEIILHKYSMPDIKIVVSNLKGIEYFTNLEKLYCNSSDLTELDVSKNTALTELYCSENQLTSLDLSKNTALKELICNYNSLTSLDLSNNTALTGLYCSGNQFASLDLSSNTALTELFCSSNQLTYLDLSNNPVLTSVTCDINKLTSLDVSNNTALTELSCYNNQLTYLDVSKNTALTKLSCGANQLTSLDVSNNTALIELSCSDNQLTSLDLSNNTALDTLWCYDNQLTSLDLSNNAALTTVVFYENTYEITLTDNTFDLSTLSMDFDVTKASKWTNGTVNGNILTVKDASKNVTYKYDCGNGHSETFTLVPQIEETPVETTTAPKTTDTTTTTTAPKTTDTTTTTTVPLTTAMFTTTTFVPPSYYWYLSVYPYNKADTIYEIGEELDYSTICVYGYGGGENFHADILYIPLANCGPTVTVDASEFDNTKPGTYTIYVKWHDAVDSFDVTVVESDNAETPAATATTPAATTTTAAPKTTTTATTTTTAMFTTTTFAPPSYSCSLNVYPYDEADTIYEIGEELDYSTICVHGYGTMTSFGSTTYMDIPYISLDRCNLTVDASEFDNTKPGTYTIYVKWYDAVDSFDVTVIDPDNPTAIPGVGIDETNFPDAIFRKYVAEEFDKNKDGRLSDKESADVTDLSLGELGISDLTGIQHFENLFSLWCYDNNLTTLDVSNNTELKILVCSSNQLTSLDVSHNTLLTDLVCNNNQLASVDLSNTNCLEGWEFGVNLTNNKHRIKITDNTFDLSTLPTNFDVTKASDWTNATVKGNILTIEDITKQVTYTYNCGLGFSETFTFVPYNDASEMDVEINEITFPDAIFRKYIEENFDKDGNKILSYDELVKATFMEIKGLEVSDMTGLQHFFNLQHLYCGNNRITSLDVSNNTELEVLSCYNNQITSLDLSNNTALTLFSCDDNKYKIALTNNTFDLSTLPGGFDISKASDWKNATVKDNILTVIDDTALITYSYKCGEEVVCFNLFTSNYVGETFEEIEIDNNNFPDDVFRRYVAEEFDENNDWALSYDEVMNVTYISLNESNLYDLTGIQYFKNLSSLWCYDNNLTTLDVSNNTELKILVCSSNQLTSLDVSHNTLLTDLVCNNNQLASVDLSNTNCLEGWEFGVNLTNNKHRIKITDNTFDLSTLPTNFDVTKASDWTNATVKGNILTIEDITKEVTYTYNCGLGFSDTFTLVPQIEETPVETTTTTTTTTETTTTTTTTATTTTPATTPAGTAPEEELPQTGFSKLYNCIPVSAGALVLLGMYAVKKSKKEDEEE